MAYNIQNRPNQIFDEGCYENDNKTKNVAMDNYLELLCANFHVSFQSNKRVQMIAPDVIILFISHYWLIHRQNY